MRGKAVMRGTYGEASEFQLENGMSPRVVGNELAMSRFSRLGVACVHIAMALFMLFLGFTQVYANVSAFGWTGFGALLLIAPLVSFAYMWFNLRVRSLRVAKRVDPESANPESERFILIPLRRAMPQM